jgi:ABC-type amino acid transport substrate-binding protein
VDFSRPFLLNYASILTTPETRNVFWTILTVVKMIMPVLFFLLTVLCCITLVFVFTRDLTEERGLMANAFCAVMALMRMGGYVQKPNALLSRVVVMILAFFSVFFMATFSAVMTDALLLVEQPQDPFVVLSDLKGKTFIVAEGSTFVEVVRGYDANVVEIPDAEYAGRYYFANRSKYDGFVGDQALVQELARQLSSREIIQSGINLRNDELVFLYNKRFPYQDEVDEGILRLQDKNVSMLICAHYLGVDSKLCVL